MGYPSKQLLMDWIDELAPNERKLRPGTQHRYGISLEEKIQAVAELEARTGSAAEVAERYGMPRTEPYLWRKRIMGDNGGGAEEKGTAVSKEFDELPDDIDELRDMLREAQVQLIHGGDLRGTRQHLPRQARQTPFLSGGTKRALGY